VNETKPNTLLRRSAPNTDRDIQPFWDNVANRQLSVMRCKTCGAYYWPASYCRNHDNEPFLGNMEWVPASGKGTVFAFNVHHWAFDAALKEQVPYVYALIELEEGPLIGSNVIDCDPSEVRVGLAVEVTFREFAAADGDVFTLHQFVPAGTQSTAS